MWKVRSIHIQLYVYLLIKKLQLLTQGNIENRFQYFFFKKSERMKILILINHSLLFHSNKIIIWKGWIYFCEMQWLNVSFYACKFLQSKQKTKINSQSWNYRLSGWWKFCKQIRITDWILRILKSCSVFEAEKPLFFLKWNHSLYIKSLVFVNNINLLFKFLILF